MRLTLRPCSASGRTTRPSIARRSHGYTLTARDRRIEISGDAALPPLRLRCTRPTGAFTVDDDAIPDVRYLSKSIAATSRRGPLWSPGYFRARARARPRRHAHRLDRSLGNDRRASIPPTRVATERDGARRLVAAAHPAARIGLGRRAGARRRPVHHHARRRAPTTRRARAPAATRRARSSPAITGSPTGAATR